MHTPLRQASPTLQGFPSGKKMVVKISPSRVKINSNQAHHLTLVINELTTNTLKYALKNRQKAEIEIQIQEQGRIVEIVFRDDGPGYPDELFQEGFSPASIGVELIRGITRRSLNGEIIFKNDNGAVSVISFQNSETTKG